MAMDYDLVILGCNQWSQKLATTANAHGARTAWLTFPEIVSPLSLEQMIHDRSTPWEEIQQMGVDVIRDSGNFIRKQTIQVRHRQITSRHFVICGRDRSPNWNPRIFDCLRWQDFLSFPLSYQSVAIGGGSADSCMVAQWLNRKGKEVHLFLPSDRVLPKLDMEVGRFLQATLEAQGIAIYPNHRVTAVKGTKIWASGAIFQTDIMIMPHFRELVDALNLVFVPPSRLHYFHSAQDIYPILHKVLWGMIPKPAGTFQIVATHPPIVQWQSDTLNNRSLVARSFVHGFTKVLTDRRGKVIFVSSIGKESDLLLDTLPDQYLPRLPAIHPLIADLQAQFDQQKSPHPLLKFVLSVAKDFNFG